MKLGQALWFAAAFSLVWIGEAVGADAVLHGKINDALTGRPTPCTVDSHVHMLHGERTVPVDFDYVALTAKAEDLQYMSLAQAWNLDDPTPERLEGELGRRSTPDCSLTWNLEAPKNYYRGDAGRCLGHCWTIGVRGRTREGRDVIHMFRANSLLRKQPRQLRREGRS